MKTALTAHLEALVSGLDTKARLAADPVAFPHRYSDARDQEIAAYIASSLAFGRVAAFRTVIAKLLDGADRSGGPRAYVERFDPKRDGAALLPLVYRWHRGIDFVLLMAMLGRFVGEHGSLEAGMQGKTAPEALEALMLGLRAAAVKVGRSCGVQASSFADLPRSFRTFLPLPSAGSACKRANMFLRWMIRGPDGIDLGLWTVLPPAALVIPLDTHVLRISRFLGLTQRKDGSLKTALAITDALRTLDPVDPVRFDFALAHLGISGACRGHRDAAVCPSCPLEPLCLA